MDDATREIILKADVIIPEWNRRLMAFKISSQMDESPTLIAKTEASRETNDLANAAERQGAFVRHIGSQEFNLLYAGTVNAPVAAEIYKQVRVLREAVEEKFRQYMREAESTGVLTPLVPGLRGRSPRRR